MSEQKPATVEQLPGSMITLSDEERAELHELLGAIEQVQAAIGADREQHLLRTAELEAMLDAEEKRAARAERKLMKLISEWRAKYKSFVDVLAKRHVSKWPGKRFDFRPELGAFVETRRNGSES
jgi:hypothetical protein